MAKTLTERELKILKLIVGGKSNVEIAYELNLSVYTVKLSISSIFQKMSVTDRVQAAVKAVREKLF